MKYRRVSVIPECDAQRRHHSLTESLAWEEAMNVADNLRYRGCKIEYLNVLKDGRGYSYEIDYKTV